MMENQDKFRDRLVKLICDTVNEQSYEMVLLIFYLLSNVINGQIISAERLMTNGKEDKN